MSFITKTTTVTRHGEILRQKYREGLIDEITKQDFPDFIAELYRGNGWIVSKMEVGSEKYLALSEPGSPREICLLVMPVYSERTVDAERVRSALMVLEKAGEFHNCNQFSIAAPRGFGRGVHKFSMFNLLLHGPEHIGELWSGFRKDNYSKPQIQLFSHNLETYRKVLKQFRTKNAVAVVQATGTGKSYLIAKLLESYRSMRRIVLAPSMYVLDQLKQAILWDKDITYLTYSKLMYMNVAELRALDPGFIVLDEFHRCGAEEWGKGVQNLLSGFPLAKIFGTSATPIRYLDNSRDMSAELFNNHVAENLNLAQAITRRILPMPRYVSALYTIKEEAAALQKKISSSAHSREKKHALLAHLDQISMDWEMTSGIPEILNKHLRPSMKKFIVFCREQDHLNEMIGTVSKWFRETGFKTNLKVYKVLAAEAESDANLRQFINVNEDDTVHLLFSINMLNEGLHVNDVHGVLLLRPTISPNIFYQQIGRCLKVGLGQKPVIFDLVNNFRSIRSKDFLYELDFFSKGLDALRIDAGLEPRHLQYHISDETRRITDLFGKIEFELDIWETRYEQLRHYKDQFGTSNIPRGCTEKHKKLRHWLLKQRVKQKHGLLEKERELLLTKLGVAWVTKSLKRRDWETYYGLLVKYHESNGHCNVPQRDKGDGELGAWVADQRDAFRNNKIDPSRKARLDDLGFEWNLQYRFDVVWEKRFNELQAYRKLTGHCNVPAYWEKNRKLGRWVSYQRKSYKMNRFITAEKISRLESIGFIWNPDDIYWNEQLEKLIAFKKKFGHLNVSNSAANNPYRTLGGWVSIQRRLYKKGTLSADKIRKLNEIGFLWSPVDIRWDEMYERLISYRRDKGHIQVRQEDDKKLHLWISNLKRSISKKRVDKDKIAKLHAIDFFTTSTKREVATRTDQYA